MNQQYIRKATRLVLALLIVTISRTGFAILEKDTTVLTNDIEFSCEESDDQSDIKCAYRLVEPEIIKQITVSLGDKELPIKDIRTYPYADSTTSILLLVDTSKTQSFEAFAQIKEHVVGIVEQALPHQQIGLVSYDAQLDILKPLGSDPGQIISATSDLIETELPTELYGNMLHAMKLLETSNADRKTLYLFSSGTSDDEEVYPDDVIKAAKESGIKIISIAYPFISDDNADEDAEDKSREGVKNLRQLAESSGGMYVSTSFDTYELPEAFLSDPFAVIDNGGTLTIDLTPAHNQKLDGLQLSTLLIETLSKRITVKLPITFDDNPNKQVTNQGESVPFGSNGKQANYEPGSISAGVEEPTMAKYEKLIGEFQSKVFSPSTPLFWLAIPLIILLVLWLLLRLGRSKEISETAETVVAKKSLIKTKDKGKRKFRGKAIPDKDKSYPCLESLNDSSNYNIIERSPCSIGRTRQNDVFLEHSSVSRKHAEIRRNRDGSYTISDLDSLNGIFVNNTKVSAGIIKEDDKIDVGDVRLRFVFRSSK